MRNKLKTFSIISLLFISFLFLQPGKVNAAASGASLIIDYENTNFKEFYTTNIESRLDNIISACRTRLSTDEVMIGYTKAPNSRDIFECFDVSFDDDIIAYVQRTGTSYADLKLEFPSTKYASIYVDTLGNYSSIMNYFTTNSFYAPTYYSDSQEFITDFTPNSSIRNILFYSDKDNIIFTNDDNLNNKLVVNGKNIDYGSKVPIYNNLGSNFITINDKCSIPGECLTHELELVVEVPQDDNWYNLHYYTEDGKLDKSQSFTDGGGYQVSIDLELYHNTTLYVDFQKLVCPSADDCVLETIQSLEYDVNVLYSDPTIKYTLSETEEKYYLAIDYKLPLDYSRSDYFFQYRVDNGEWILSNNIELQLLEFDLGKNYYIEARMLNGYQNVVAYSSFNINTSLLPFVRFEIYEDEQEYKNTKVFISNVLSDGYSYTWDSGSGLTGPFKLTVSKDEVMVLQSRFGRSTNLYINIYDKDNNVVGTFSLDIDVKRVPTIYNLDSSDSIFSYLTNYFDGLSADLKQFGDGLQDIVDEISGTSIEQVLVVLLIIICLITTIKLGGS